MPLPKDPLELIRWDDGAPKFNAKAGGLSGWWDHYSEARLFFLVCAQAKAEDVGLISKREVNALVPQALRAIKEQPGQAWRKALYHDEFWDSLHTSQIRAAFERQRLGLIKALQVAVVIEMYLASKGVDTSSYYDEVYIKPATYRVLSEESRFTPDPCQPAIDRLYLAPQPSASRIITEHKAGQHVCYVAATAIVGNQAGTSIDFARRTGTKGAMQPAARSLRYQCLNESVV